MIEGAIKVGDRFLHEDGSASKVLRVYASGGSIRFLDESEGAAYTFEEVGFRNKHTHRLPPEGLCPPASQHPADLKPRTGKAPLHLIPWSVVPEDLTPIALTAIAHERHGQGEPLCLPDGDEIKDGDEVGRGDVRALPFYLLRELAAQGVTMAEIAGVFAYGAAKYARNNWRSFTWDKAAEDAYFGAIMRHLDADRTGETNDPESGLRHRAHAACGCLIWLWHVSDERKVSP